MPFRFNPFTDKLDLTETGGGPGTGKFVQQVQTSLATYLTTQTLVPDDDTIPQNTEGDPVINLSITPTSGTNLLVFDFSCPTSSDGTSVAVFSLFQDSTANALYATENITDGPGISSTSFRFYMIAGTTSTTTFKIRWGVAASSGFGGSVFINGNDSGRVFGGVANVIFTISEVNP